MLTTDSRNDERTTLQGEDVDRRAAPGEAVELREHRRKKLRKIRHEIESVDEQIRALKARRDKLASERDRLSSLVRYVPGDSGYRDYLFVKTSDLKPHIDEFIENSRIDKRTLAERAKVNEKTILRAQGDHEYVSLNTADRIMIAIGKQEEIADFRLYRRNGPVKGWKPIDEALEKIAERDEEFLQMPY